MGKPFAERVLQLLRANTKEQLAQRIVQEQEWRMVDRAHTLLMTAQRDLAVSMLADDARAQYYETARRMADRSREEAPSESEAP